VIWPFGHRHEVSAEAQVATQRSQHALAIAEDLDCRAAVVHDQLARTLERNHFAQHIEQTMMGVRR